MYRQGMVDSQTGADNRHRKLEERVYILEQKLFEIERFRDSLINLVYPQWIPKKKKK